MISSNSHWILSLPSSPRIEDNFPALIKIINQYCISKSHFSIRLKKENELFMELKDSLPSNSADFHEIPIDTIPPILKQIYPTFHIYQGYQEDYYLAYKVRSEFTLSFDLISSEELKEYQSKNLLVAVFIYDDQTLRLKIDASIDEKEMLNQKFFHLEEIEIPPCLQKLEKYDFFLGVGGSYYIVRKSSLLSRMLLDKRLIAK